MTQFDLTWDNTSVVSNPNANAQRVSYRYKVAGGAWITVGFTPANDLLLTVKAATSPSLNDNKVVEFKVESICQINGPTINDNGPQDGIGFACINVTTSGTTHNQATGTVDLTSTDITKVRFTLKKSSDNSVVLVPTIVNKVGTSAAITVTGLSPLTNYYWQAELYANVNNVEVKSSDVGYLGTPCSPYAFATLADPVCDPITAATISSIEV